MVKKKEANFYKLSNLSFPKVFPKLLESIIGGGNKVLILAENDEQVCSLDNSLWTYSQLSFLPHLTYKDELREESPIYITTSEQDNVNQANFIAILSESYNVSNISNFEKYMFFYDEDTIEKTKKNAEKFIKMEGVCNYIMQDNLGKWIKSGSIL